jgi:inosose dehydratase
MSNISRRGFLGACAGVTTSALLAKVPGSDLLDLVTGSALAAPAGMSFGYAAITWNGNDAQAIKDISEVGFKGVQLRTSVLADYSSRPAALRELLAAHHLKFTAFSSGGVRIGAGTEKDEIDKHVRNAEFVRDAGGLYLQVTDSARPKDRKPTAEEFKQLGRVMNEIARRTADLGVPLGYHNHMNSLGEAPDEVDQVMDAAIRLVGLSWILRITNREEISELFANTTIVCSFCTLRIWRVLCRRPRQVITGSIVLSNWVGARSICRPCLLL